ncbi:MAG: Rpn family recombination-promoting nuclease/putative transposase [Alphaproteobacteria bacterium]
MSSDAIYHRLFSHPVMVESLVRGFIPEAMAVGLDFSRMERVNAKFHGRQDRRREGDVIWRLPTHGGEDIYLYLLIEFQSQSDWWMIVRILVYVGLLWQQIVNEQKLKVGDRLPPVLPIVIHNGDVRWTAPNALSDLITLPPDSPLWHWQPWIRYYLLDEGAFPGDELARREGLAALLFRLETSHEPGDLLAAVDEVVAWFRQHPDHDALRQVFTEVVQQAMRGPGDQNLTVPLPDDMLEVRAMLATKVEKWQRQWKAEGRAEGRAEMLLRQLSRRFGALSPDVEERVWAADVAQLDEWMDRLMDARELADVLDAPTTH